jgi:NAD-dependent DNA ligase
MTQRERGAISAVWFVFVIVLFLGALGIVYTQQGELKRARDRAAAAEATSQISTDNLETERSRHLELSGLVGFRSGAGAISSQEALKAKIEEYANLYPNAVGPSDKSVEAVFERLRSLADRFQAQAAEAEQARQTALTDRSAADDARNATNREMQAQLDSVNNELADARNVASQQQQAADSRLSDMQSQIDNLTVQKNEADAEHQRTLSQATAEVEKSRGRVTELAKKVEIIGSDDAPWAADGSVIEIGKSAGLVFVDIGSKDMLRTGVKFDVFRIGKGGELVRKGTIEVRELASDHAIAGVVEQLDWRDPIVKGDLVANPLFSRNHTKNFVLLGNFPAYGTEFLKSRLESLGCEVSDRVSARTDFLLLGEKSLEEDAPELTDDESYKLAREFGVQVMRLRDIERFIRP